MVIPVLVVSGRRPGATTSSRAPIPARRLPSQMRGRGGQLSSPHGRLDRPTQTCPGCRPAASWIWTRRCPTQRPTHPRSANDCRMMKFVFTAVATRALASTAAYSSTAAGRSQSDGPNSTVSAAAPSTIRCWSSPVPGAFPSNLRRVHEHGRLRSVERRRLGPTGKIG
jgi:hypothetical protein